MSYFTRITILPVGSYEYHGADLPPETDEIIASRVAKSLSEALVARFPGSTNLLPALPYGLSGEHQGLPTTGYVEHCTYYDFVLQLIASLSQPRDLVVVINGHGGNTYALAALEADFNYKYADRKVFMPHLYPNPVRDLSVKLVGEFDAHAGSVEASLISHYFQQSARSYEVVLPKRVRGALRFFRTAEVTTHGVIKQSPTVIADPHHGSALHQAMVQNLLDAVLRLTEELEAVLGNGD